MEARLRTHLQWQRPRRHVLKLGQPIAHAHVLLVGSRVDAEDGLDQLAGLLIRDHLVDLHLGENLDDAILLLGIMPEISLPQIFGDVLTFW